MTGPAERRQRNLRTALILLTIALAFFLGVMAKYWLIGK
ncbi:MAG: cytochrome oxidase small assembly protein [Burkholderiaceae bacterium]